MLFFAEFASLIATRRIVALAVTPKLQPTGGRRSQLRACQPLERPPAAERGRYAAQAGTPYIDFFDMVALFGSSSL